MARLSIAKTVGQLIVVQFLVYLAIGFSNLTLQASK
jgi:hypothetical protein